MFWTSIIDQVCPLSVVLTIVPPQPTATPVVESDILTSIRSFPCGRGFCQTHGAVPVGTAGGSLTSSDLAVAESKPCLNGLMSLRRVRPSTLMANSATTMLPVKNRIRIKTRRLKNAELEVGFVFIRRNRGFHGWFH